MVVKIRGTVSRLCASTSGRAPKTSASSSGTALKSGISSSTPVPGLRAWTWRTVSAYSQAPPSDRSSRATPVTVEYRRPMVRTDSATRRGSSASKAAGLPVSIWQKSHRRVHRSPPIRNVASRSSQHSKMLGQPASSHTVCRPPPCTSCLSSVYAGPIVARVRIHSGFFSIGVAAFLASTRSMRRPSGAIVTRSGYVRPQHGSPHGPAYTELKQLVHGGGLHTVCEEAGCPNIFECWEDREATFLIGGDRCTRRCDFCQIDTGKPAAFDADEPRRVAESVRTMGLRYSTVTGVARDDLSDGGAWLYAETVRQVHALSPGTGVELLIPDFNAVPELLAEVFGARPEVLAHNLETVPRIFTTIRPGFRYDRSLSVLTAARDDGLVTKSNLILGMGETYHEVVSALGDLRDAGCDLVTITQYLRPSVRHHPVDRWVRPEEFVALADEAERMGFLGVMSGPLVRSSYRAGRLWAQAMHRHGRTIPAELAHLAAPSTARQEAANLLAR